MRISPLEREGAGSAARVLAAAFDDSPLYRYLFADARQRPRALRAYWSAVVHDALPFGAVHVARGDDGERGGEPVGVAIWLPPHASPPSAGRQLRFVAHLLVRAPSLIRRARPSLEVLRAVEQAHPHEPHWYLAGLGVLPAHQGTGAGGALLDEVLARADAEGLATYLETDKERNLAYYARRRFALVDTLHPWADGPPVWTMRRDPR